MTHFNPSAFIRPHLLTLKPYSTARDEYQGKAGIFLDANENPYPAEWHRYPDPHQNQLKQVISTIKNVPAEKIFIGNGSDEVIDLLIRLVCQPGQDHIIITEPTYGMYEVSAHINNVPVRKVSLTQAFDVTAEAIIQRTDNQSKILFLCSPNNPTGNLLNKNQIENILDNFTGLVVIDEAYIDFADDPGFLPQLDKWPNLIVMQTLSKAYGLAGLRIGLAFGHPELIAWLNKIKPPQKLAIEKLSRMSQIRKQVEEIIYQRKLLAGQLQQLPIVEQVFPSQANFLLVRFTRARQVYQYLLSKGIIVRDRTAVLHGTNCLRITVGTPQENNQLIRALLQLNLKA